MEQTHKFDPHQELAAYESLPDNIRYPAAELSEVVNLLSTELRLNFQTAIRQSLDVHPEVSDNFKQNAIAKAYDLPTVEIFDNSEGMRQRLRNLEIDQETISRIKSDEVVMTIHLPAPMRIPWGESKATENFEVWHDAYYAGINVLWDTANNFAYEHSLSLERINPIGIHDFDKGGYYYIWHFAPTGREPLFP